MDFPVEITKNKESGWQNTSPRHFVGMVGLGLPLEGWAELNKKGKQSREQKMTSVGKDWNNGDF